MMLVAVWEMAWPEKVRTEGGINRLVKGLNMAEGRKKLKIIMRILAYVTCRREGTIY